MLEESKESTFVYRSTMPRILTLSPISLQSLKTRAQALYVNMFDRVPRLTLLSVSQLLLIIVLVHGRSMPPNTYECLFTSRKDELESQISSSCIL